MATRISRSEGRPGASAEGTGKGEPSAPQSRVRSDLGCHDPQRGCRGKVLSPSRHRLTVDHVQDTLKVSERRACRVLGQHRSTQRKPRRPRVDEAALTADIIRLAEQYGRYGYRRITTLLRREGWAVNVKQVERIRRREGLKVPQKQLKRGRLWFSDGSCVRLRPQHKGHVWSYDFVADRFHNEWKSVPHAHGHRRVQARMPSDPCAATVEAR